MSINNSWTIEDLNNLIRDEVPESLTLDYKASGTLKKTDGGKKELAKDVSSFANSAGGKIIIGIVELDHKPNSLDTGVSDNEWSRESIEQVINSNITPRIEGLRITPIPVTAGRSYYVIEIPQATTRAPHQVMQGRKYHKRLEFTTSEMEDYEIRDAMRRADSPSLYLDLKLDSQETYEATGEHKLVFRLSTRNESTQPAFYAFSYVGVDARTRCTFPAIGAEWTPAGTASGDLDGAGVHLNSFRKHVLKSSHAPLFKEEEFFHANIDVWVPSGVDKFYVITKISCPGCFRTQAGHLLKVGQHFELTLYGFNPE